jgi:hypothetical protein
MLNKKLFANSYNLSLFLGGIAALLCGGAVYKFSFMILALLFGFVGFGLCCLHIVIVQRDESIKQASTPMLLLSLFLNSTPLLCMFLLLWLAKHGR